MRLIVLGGWGQLGTDLAATAVGRHELIRPRHSELDVTDADAVASYVRDRAPDGVVNAAAFHKVELCETDPGRAFATNAMGGLNVARAAAAIAVPSVLISTDYVFRGDSTRGYVEDGPVGPVNVYGASKAAAETLVLGADPQGIVVRGSGLFGHAGSSGKGGNFVETMLAKARAGDALQVVDDQRFAPTATRDMAERILELIERRVPAGIYHAANSGSCSWYEFARRAIELAGLKTSLTPRPTEPGPVRRPATSILLDTKSPTLGMAAARPWEDALAWYIENRPTTS